MVPVSALLAVFLFAFSSRVPAFTKIDARFMHGADPEGCPINMMDGGAHSVILQKAHYKTQDESYYRFDCREHSGTQSTLQDAPKVLTLLILMSCILNRVHNGRDIHANFAHLSLDLRPGKAYAPVQVPRRWIAAWPVGQCRSALPIGSLCIRAAAMQREQTLVLHPSFGYRRAKTPQMAMRTG